MADDSFIIRNYRPSDLTRYVQLHAESESICHSDETLFLASLTAESPRPIAFDEKDLFLAEDKGKIVGACRLVPELAIGRAVVRLVVIPGLVDQKIASKLLLCALQRAGDLNVSKVHADLRENDRTGRDLFAGIGFAPVRRYSELTLNLRHRPTIESKFEGFSLRPLERGCEAELTQLQNCVFDGVWGFCPNTPDQIIQLLNAPGYGHDGVIVAYLGDNAVGYCWTAKIRRADGDGGVTLGRIHMMGVAPEYRRQGLGKLILQAGLKHLADSGIQTVELTADNENKAACSLYEGAGFELKTSVVWYEKMIE